jgi:acetyltransferase-like isoleucine patch superfamily enzyme
MQIFTEDDFTGAVPAHPHSEQFTVLGYAEGGFSKIPHNFFRDWLDREPQNGYFYIGRCSGLGVGSIVKYDSGQQSLCVGRFVAGGLRLRFLLNGQHEMKTISTYMFSVAGMGLRNTPPPQYADSVIKNDVWIGDETMMLGGGIIENGCVIGARSLLPPNFRSEPYGIYVGSPARLVRFRFSEKVRAALVDLAWWDMPLSWIRDNNALFLQDMTADEGLALDIIAKLAASRKEFEAKHAGGALESGSVSAKKPGKA